ncbi:MAG: calcium/sodium antiporter [Hyphomicrobiaceae bacterium]|nr:calcium/sodium antiporter [Hyphomicrobiaceae bacterium]MCC0023271.1 calcium/sodium antiporter [Hyphomicrobiaceae bacterium]
MALLAFLAGLVLLALAGDQLVNGAVAIARRLDVPSFIIGLTIVSIGTSMPELVVAVEAALQNHPELAVGGVVGSNISNALLIIGLPALIAPFANEDLLTRRTGLIMVLVTLLFITFLWDGMLSRFEGIAMVVGLAAYILTNYWLARRLGADAAIAETASSNNEPTLLSAILQATLGLAGLIIGGQLTVDGALGIAEFFHLSAGAVGLTIVALGTSLPELAAGLAAARKGQPGLAVGNVIGSNIVNILGIMGITAAISPVLVPARILTQDMWIMLAAGAVLVGMLYLTRRVGRRIGALLTLAYLAYMIEVLVLGVAS